jgi:hypothetical protein
LDDNANEINGLVTAALSSLKRYHEPLWQFLMFFNHENSAPVSMRQPHLITPSKGYMVITART